MLAQKMWIEDKIDKNDIDARTHLTLAQPMISADHNRNRLQHARLEEETCSHPLAEDARMVVAGPDDSRKARTRHDILRLM